MPNELDGSEIIVLDRERRIKLTLGGLMALEEATGVNLLANPDKFEPTNLKFLLALAWVALKEDDPSLTQEQVATLLPANRLVEFMNKITAAYIGALPEPKKEGADPLASPPPGLAGSNSGPSLDTISASANRALRRSRRASS